MKIGQEIQGGAGAKVSRWPKGYAASIQNKWGKVRCCDGHATPDEAVEHGVVLTRLVLIRSVAEWRRRPTTDQEWKYLR